MPKPFFIRKHFGFISGTLLALLMFFPAYAADTVPAKLKELMHKYRIATKNSGILIMRLDTNETVASVNSDVLFNPASAIKILTSAAAIDTHSPIYTWKTRFATDGKVSNGTLHGNLYLIGGGDPSITVEKFESMLKSLYRQGIHSIAGNLIVDDSYYQLPYHSPKAFDGAEFRTYNVGANAMMANFKSLEVVINGSANGIQAYTIPPNDQFTIVNKIKPGKGRCRNWRRHIGERFKVKETSIVFNLSGRYPIRCKKQSFHLAALEPIDYIGGFFTAAWREIGGGFTGQYLQGKAPKKITTLETFESQTLAQVMTLMNKYSNNVIARHLFLSLADKKKIRSLDNARLSMQQWLNKNDIKGVVIDNGSGLSRDTRISPKDMSRVLKLIWQHPYREEIIASLPIWGLDGTLRKRPKNTVIAGRGRLKTGSLVNSKTISGYFRNQNNQPYLLVIFNKNSATRHAKSFQNAVMKWLYKKS